LPVFGLETGNGRLWPLLLGNMGILLVVAPFLARQHRGRGALFIPGIPLVVVSSLLLLSSITDWWGIWSYLWPLTIVAVALGFVAAAVWTHNVWFLLPATIIGINGLLFLFCSLTGWWEVWGAAWPVELLAVGLSLFVVNHWVRSKGLFTAGMVLSVLSGFAFALMALILSGWVSVLAALVLVGTGLALIGRNAPAELTAGSAPEQQHKFAEGFSVEDVIQIKEG
ncbi:MAG: hypothetical protein KC441_02820, partial [Anaerolineales bacterium]|nr:hypothetical protein [Anaerolineales bacterium]